MEKKQGKQEKHKKIVNILFTFRRNRRPPRWYPGWSGPQPTLTVVLAGRY